MLELRKSANFMNVNKKLLENVIKHRKNTVDLLRTHVLDLDKLWWFEERRSGKSLLINELTQTNPDWIVVQLDLFTTLSIEDFINSYASACAQAFFKKLSQEEIVKESKKYYRHFLVNFKSDTGSDFTLSIQGSADSALKECLSAPQKFADAHKKQTLLIILDEAQQLSQLPESFITQFSTTLENNDFSYLFLSSKKNQIESLFSNPNSTLHNLAQRFVMKPLSEIEWRLLITNSFNDENIQIPQKTLNAIIDYAQNQSYYISLFVQRIENLYKQDPQSIQTKPQLFLDQLVNENESFFKELIDTLTSNQKKSLLILAKTKGENIYKTQITTEYNINKSSLERCIESFEKSNLIIKTLRGTFQFRNPLLRAWILNKF